MASKQSWAEKRWWRGTVFDWMGVLLAIALVFVLAFVSVPFLLPAIRCQAASRTTTSPFIVRPVQAGSVAPQRCRTCCSPTVYAGSPPPETSSCCRRGRTGASG